VRERKIVALKNVHEHGSGIIPSIIEGNNRIGKVPWMNCRATGIR
jgi:hypothetical protein